MPLPIAHGLIGASIVTGIHPQPFRRFLLAALVGAFLANIADLDFFLVWALQSQAWHRGFTHSVGLAIVFFLLSIIVLGAAQMRKAVAYSLAFLSHGLLDYVTTKVGKGVELLWPLSVRRFGLGLIGLSENPSRMPTGGIMKAFLIEVAIFAPLFALVLLIRKSVWDRRSSSSGAI